MYRVFLIIVVAVFLEDNFVFSESKHKIKRDFYGLRLGMQFTEFSNKFKKYEIYEPLTKPEYREYTYTVIPDTPTPSVERIEVAFFDNQLYKIMIEYTKKYAEETSWSVFTDILVEKYGKPDDKDFDYSSSIHFESWYWTDEKTTLVAQKETIFEYSELYNDVVESYEYNVKVVDNFLLNKLNLKEKEVSKKKGPDL